MSGRSKRKGHTLSPLPRRRHIACNLIAAPSDGTIDIVRRNACSGDAEDGSVM